MKRYELYYITHPNNKPQRAEWLLFNQSEKYKYIKFQILKPISSLNTFSHLHWKEFIKEVK